MPPIPKDRWPDSTLALMGDPYGFIGKRCRGFGTDLFQARLVLRPTVCMSGPEAAALFYDEARLSRAGVAPGWLKKRSSGRAASRASTGRRTGTGRQCSCRSCRRRAWADWFRAYARKWAGREQVVFYDEVNEILARAACDWAGVPLAESDVGRRTAELMAMFDRAATLSPAHLWSRLARWRAERWIGDLIGQADLRPGVSSLDVGCGTGTLALAVAAACPGLTTVGLDADPDVLGLAVGKAARTGSVVRFDQGLATALPYPDESFDHVFSSLMLHHLTGEERRAALREVVRVLKPGGRFHLVDWCRPHTPFMWIAFLAVRTLDGFGRTADSARGRLPALLREAGLGEPERLGRYATVGGTLCRYRAKKS